MELLSSKNISRIVRTNERHLAKLTRCLFRHIQLTDNAVVELSMLGLQYRVAENAFYDAKRQRPAQVPALVESLLNVNDGIEEIDLRPTGAVLVRRHSGWEALP